MIFDIKINSMHTEHSYEVDVNWIKDRIGVLYSPDLNDEVQVATPPQFPKGVEKVWSPEHLFTAAINSCLMTTFLSIAESSKLEFHKFTSKAYGKLEMTDGKYLMSEVTLVPSLTILREEDREKAMRILHKSESACLISNSVKSKIILNPKINIKS
jgi:organic hydroperoxide reductase OsmC/OhrA